MWNSIKAEMDSTGKNFADEHDRRAAKKISEDRRSAGALGRLVLSEIGEKNKSRLPTTKSAVP